MEKYNFTRLECVNNKHNKFYEIWIEKIHNDGFVVKTLYGKIGTSGSPGVSTSHWLNKTATASLESLVSTKLAKGYKITSTTKQISNIPEKVSSKPIKKDVIIRKSRLGLIKKWGKDSS